MRSSKSSRNMVKNALKVIAFSAIALLLACSSSTTYKRAEIVQSFVSICKKEFNMDIKAWDIGETIWVYVPLDHLMNDKNQFYPDVNARLGHVFLALRRIILSIDKQPKFYSLVFSDVKEKGADFFYIGYVPDMIKVDASMISLGQWYERAGFSYSPNPKAMGDLTGSHFTRADITLGDLIAFLVRQAIEVKYTDKSMKDFFLPNSVETYYHNNKLEVIFDIEPIAKDEKSQKQLPPPVFKTVKDIVKKFILIYDFKNLPEIEINDIANKKKRVYSLPAFMDDITTPETN